VIQLESKNRLIKNTTMLYIMNIAKLIFPLLTLPYLTRVLSKECYGTVSYVKAVMQYMQIVVDFGFTLSATKDIVTVRNNHKTVSEIIGSVLCAKLMLASGAFIILIICIVSMPILRENTLFTLLSFVTVLLTCFLFDFLFRGIEEMQVITIRYVLMRSISTILTFVFVADDADIIWIPILEIIGSLLAISLVLYEIKKRGYSIGIAGIKASLKRLKESAVYFWSSMATTTFTALNTIIIGICLSAKDVANWGLCFQLVSAVMAFYTPITDGIYPHMVKYRDLMLIKKLATVFMTIISIGCIVTFVIAKYVLIIVGGDKYIDAVPLLRAFIPLLFFSFPAMLVGWPTLGAIGKVKETTITTIITAIIQIVGMLILSVTGKITVIKLALLRGGTDACMMGMRLLVCKKYKEEFSK